MGCVPYIKKCFLKHRFLPKKLGLDYILLVSEKSCCNFFSVSKISNGSIISFEILKFSLRSKPKSYLIEKRKLTNKSIFLLNNFSQRLKKDILVEAIFKEIFFLDKNKDLNLRKQKKILFLDFIKPANIIECRFYIIWGAILLVPRKFRTKLIPNSKEKIKKKLLVNKFTTSKILEHKNTEFSLNLEEKGPRLSLKLIEMIEKIQKKN